MNEDHALSVFAMAKRKLAWAWPSDGGKWKISEATLISVSMEGCLIQVVMCRDDLCQVQKVLYPFEPPLKDAAELRPRMVAIHQDVCKPSLRSIWLSNPPLAPFIVILYAGFAFCTLVIGLDQLTEDLESNSLISTCFGSAHTFVSLVKFGFYVIQLAHLCEALYVAYSSRALKFSSGTVASWTLQALLAGFPATLQFQELLNMNRKNKEAKKQKSG